MANERASWKRDGGIGGREARGQVEEGGEEEVEETASHHWVAYTGHGKEKMAVVCPLEDLKPLMCDDNFLCA